MRMTFKCSASKASLAALVVLSSAAISHAQTYGGRAYGALVGGIYFADTGSLPPSGGTLTASESSIVYGVLSTGPATSSCAGGGGIAESAASVQAVVVSHLEVEVLTCDAVMAQTDADCAGVKGGSTISGLVFAGVEVQVTGEANQTVTVPDVGTLVINETITTEASIIVNALHLTLATGDELILCGCESTYECPTSVDLVTWGRIKGLYR